ncbi:MAG: Uma2 family endonuclease [Symploca sp. SIO2E6]|nr:Uma2 family endonuclease [Symploca sp. SIO2E6]
MEWQEVCENKYLKDLPFKIELNKWGQIVMSPAKPKHSICQGLITDLLNSLIEQGMAFPECAIDTPDNVKVADVVWASDARLDIIEEEDVASIAPEICVEVKSASNTIKEMEEKKDLYLAAKAEEVWLCDQTRRMRFYNRQGELGASLLVPDFPKQIGRRKGIEN